METFVIILGAIAVVIILNIIIYRIILRQALSKFIIPYLEPLGYTVVKTRFVGFFLTGDLKREGFAVRPVMLTGSPVISSYTYLYIRSQAGLEERITARFTSLFIWVTSVEYSKINSAA